MTLALLTMLPLTCLKINAQNLVNNPSFEDFDACPLEFGGLEKVVPSWHQPTDGSTDYFNSCSTEMSTAKNFMGGQSAYDGNGYAGMYAYAPKDYREYLTAEFKEPLKRSQKYVFSFQISLAEESQYGVNEFGILFTTKPLDLNTKQHLSINPMTRKKGFNYTIIRSHKYFADKQGWTEVSGTYIATGGEGFMTIGNFNANKNTRLLESGTNLKKVAYYYVDMFAMKPLKSEYKLDEVYVLENLMFDFNGFDLEEKGREQLESLVAYLKAHRGYAISIYGHTDNIGSKEYNKELSQKRAKAVAQFLVKNGLQPNRILWRGYGDLNPLAKNRTDEERGRNRRVEFVLSREKRDYYASGVFEDQ